MPVRAPIDPVAALTARVAALEVALERLRPPRSRTAADDVALLAAMASTVRGHVFSARELRAHAALHPVLGDALDAVSVKQLGKWLRRLSASRIGPYRLTSVGRDAHGHLWRLQVIDLQSNA